MNVYNDLSRIIDQILGKRNMFEYQTTIANQAYLLYSLFGKIYTTDKIHHHTKFLLLFAFASMMALGVSQATFGVLFYKNEDLLTQMYAMFITFCAAFQSFLVLTTYAHRQLIESTIEMIDKLVAKNSINSGTRGERIDTKVLLYVPVIFAASLMPFFLACVLDVTIFYDESKVKNNIYYIIPLPKLEQYGSIRLYVVFNIGCAIAGSTVVFGSTIIMILPLMWAIVCHNEVLRIAHHLSSLSDNLHDHTIEALQVSFEHEFKTTIVQCVHAYRDVVKTIEYFRGYYETVANILLPVVLYMEVVHTFILMTTTHSYIVKLKEFSALFSLLQMIYIYCWVGETLNEMTNTMSFAVYSTPWYMSTKIRKDVYIFLCQTQNSINLAAWRVYPLSLATLLRFMNVVQSSANVLRVVATK